MSSKIGVLLSLVFVAMFTLLGCDMMSIQYVYSDLDAKAVMIGYHISKNGYVNDELIEAMESRYQVHFEYTNPESPMYGDVFDFVISEYYQPIIISKNKMTIRVKRSAVIGYYG